MDEFPGLLTKDFGFKSQGKSAPMAASKGTIGNDIKSSSFSSNSSNRAKSSFNSTSIGGGSFIEDHEGLFRSSSDKKTREFEGLDGYHDVFGGKSGTPLVSSFDYDSMFQGLKNSDSKVSTLPVFDKPKYDDEDIFDGVPGLKSSSSVRYDNVFSSMNTPKQSASFDDLLGNLGKTEPELKSKSRKKSVEVERDVSAFDDLLPGFGGSSPLRSRTTSETSRPPQSTVPSTKSTSSVIEDPFVGLESASVPAYASSGLFTKPFEQTDKPSQSGNTKGDISSVRGEIFDDIDPVVGLAKSQPFFRSGMNNRGKDESHLGTSPYMTQNSAGREPSGGPSGKTSENASQKKDPVDNYQDSHQSLFDMPTVSSDSHQAFTQNGSPPYTDTSPAETNSSMSPKSEDHSEAADDIWLTVSEVPLFTLPTRAPPPSRPPPSRPQKVSKEVKGSFSSVNSKRGNEFPSFHHSSQNYRSPRTVPDAVKSSGFTPIDELEDFGMVRPQSNADEHGDVISSEEDVETNSAAAASAAAMKEAMDRAEAKFKHAREVRERENAKVAKNRGAQLEKDENVMQEAQERDLREKQERLDHEREQREREEKEREQRKNDKERERTREIEREREKGRQAVERATKEARERAAAEARQKAQRAAVDKVNAGARERAERAAVQRAQAEARERAATEARERAEKVAAEAKERANAEAKGKAAAVARAESEARIRAERASVDRATAEARQRAAAAAAKGNQQKNENDLDSIFNTSARSDSASRSKTSSSDPAFDSQLHNMAGPEGTQHSSAGTSSSMRKASSTPNIVDDLTSIFGATPSSGDFQEIGGESDERRRARLERNQRTNERAKKALAEKNERDLHTQWEQAERHRIAETLDFEIKRWSAGKEGNLRALLSTLQYVLWPECGWQPVSLTDLITSAAVKKVYRKATLCIHPDKVQQKGANLQQKYIAEKVFDLLKDAWNKLNSEELF